MPVADRPLDDIPGADIVAGMALATRNETAASIHPEPSGQSGGPASAALALSLVVLMFVVLLVLLVVVVPSAGAAGGCGGG
jgi:hypothetical protein